MKGALPRSARVAGVLSLLATVGCAENDLSLSIVQMQVVSLPSCVAMASMGTGTVGRSRGLLDVALVNNAGYIGVPVVRNNLMAHTAGAGSIELNSIQVTGADVDLQLPAAAGNAIAAADRSFFIPAAPGRIDPGGATPMFIEIVPAKLAKQLAPSVPQGGLLTIIVEIRPVGVIGGSQVVGGPIFYPVDLCSNCLVTTVTGGTCPFPVGTMVRAGGCFPQQDDPTDCCRTSAGVVLCGANAVAKM
jgi:hypothetical protein